MVQDFQLSSLQYGKICRHLFILYIDAEADKIACWASQDQQERPRTKAMLGNQRSTPPCSMESTVQISSIMARL